MNGTRRFWLLAAAPFLLSPIMVRAQQQKIVWSDREKPIVEQLRQLRSLSDSERPEATRRLAIQIRQLPVTAKKELLANQLTNLATEGDPGHDVLQEVATTFAQALAEQPVAADKDRPAMPYIMLAQLVRYEHVQASLDDPQFAAAMKGLEADEQRRQNANFTLADLNGKKWTLKDLRGKVVLVNFWATWCPPCRKEMPDLEALYQRFEPRGLVILAISDEDAGKVKPFVEEHKFSYPILLDPGRKVNDLFHVEGIPKSFVFDRAGKLVAQAIDMRTRGQFLEMLAQAGLREGTPGAGAAQAPQAAALERHDGFLPFYWDAARGKILFEIPKLNEDLLYRVGAGKGVGSVELGVDRGASDASTVIYFERVGPRVQVVQRNLKFRALQGNAALKQGMEESFASSVLAALPVESDRDGKLIVDATPLLMRDAVNIEGVLRRANQGNYKMDPARSSIYLAKTKGFPKNTEVEVTLTYAADAAGPLVNAVAPDGRSMTIRLHHSFVEPPDNGYKPRVGDPRIGAGGLSFKDYSKPYYEETDTHWVHRFRLEKKDPGAKISEPKQPLIYYLDAGIPEPIRGAMRDGILWWNAAFEAAGFRNAIVVKDPTPDMDPMDIRYNFVFWVNRDARGFSVGGSFSDPRTGEILAARARMDSARIRTVGNYWKSYRPEMTGGDDCGFLPSLHYLFFAPSTGKVTEESLVTLRQALVTAHEVGHTLGFPHAWNSSMNDRASVMEYPSPRIKLTADNKIDLSDAFQRQIGEFDKYMVRYSYTELPGASEKEGLNAIVAEMREKGLIYTPATDPRWNRYDDLSDAATYLRETMKQRKVLMSNYGVAALNPGEELGDLRGEGLWMTYLHHRWAIDSGVRYIGGMYHNYVVKGDTLPPTEIVPAAFQREILGLLITAIQPENLAIPEPLLAALTTDPHGRGGEFGGPPSSTSVEKFKVSTGYAFDHLSAARTLTDMVIGQVLEPETAARLISFADRQENALTLPEVITKLLDGTWNAPRDATPMMRSLRRVTRQVVLDDLMMLAVNPKSTPETRAVVMEQLVQLKTKVAGMHDPDAVTEATLRQSERDVTRFLANPSANAPKSAALPQPAGPPL